MLAWVDGDLVRALRHVGEHRLPVGQHLEEATADEEQLLLAALRDLQRTRLEDGHERRVVGQDAKLAVDAVGDDEVDVTLEEAALDADDSQWNRHYWLSFFFMAWPCSRASSIVPTM